MLEVRIFNRIYSSNSTSFFLKNVKKLITTDFLIFQRIYPSSIITDRLFVRFRAIRAAHPINKSRLLMRIFVKTLIGYRTFDWRAATYQIIVYQ